MKGYKHQGGLQLYETNNGYSIALSIHGRIHYYLLLNKKVSMRKRGFRENTTSTDSITNGNRFFPSLVERLEKTNDRSD